MRGDFGKHTLRAFRALLDDLREALEEALDEAPAAGGGEAVADARAWCASVRESVLDDDAHVAAFIDAWHARVAAPPTKAKYARAVERITAAPATTYHAIHYRDAAAVDGSLLAPATVEGCVRAVGEEGAPVLWRYLLELSKAAYAHKDAPLPAVPSHEQIADNIRSKKKGGGGAPPSSSSSSSSAPPSGLMDGLDDLWGQLCALRGAAPPRDGAPRARLRELLREGGEVPVDAFPELGDAPLADEERALVERMRSLVTMDDAIPTNMMRGIEQVAGRLVGDIQSGKVSLEQLDLERIGKEVLSGVDESDMDDFAKNMDKILPALQAAQRGM